MPHALADALPDFGSTASPRPHDPGRGALPRFDAMEATREALPAPALKDMISEEVERARAETTERLAAEHEAALEAERERHAAEVEFLKGSAGEEAARLISHRLGEMEERLVEITGSITARILASVLAEDLRKRALDDLAARIRAALADDEAVRIRVRGAPFMWQSLEKSLDSHASQVDFSPDDRFDLTVTIDESVYETRLAEWSAAVGEAVA